MTRRGKPLRFLAAVLAGWTALRVWALWPATAPIVASIAAVSQAPHRVAARAVVLVAIPPATRHRGAARRDAPSAPLAGTPYAEASVAPVTNVATAQAAVPPSLLRFGDPLPPPAPAWPSPNPPSPAGSRLSGSFWMLARGGGRSGVLTAGQLGGAQAGLRLAYALDDARRLAVAARLSSPLRERGLEAAVGLAWRPRPLPVMLIAEQRIGIDHARGGPTLGVIAGIDPTPIVAGFRLEAYGQAGVIARDGVEGFADGAVRTSRSMATDGGLRIDVGAGAWGGAQRGASRLDIGPSVALTLPVAGHALRATLDWRQRIAGGARPGSGPALSLGADF